MADPMKLGDFVTLQRGTTYKSRLLGEEGRVLLGLASIQRNGGFRADSLKRYAGESPEKICVRPGELFVALKDVTQSADLLGAVARVPEEVGVGRLTQDTVKLSFTGAPTSPNFIHWVLRTPQYRSYCREHALGTTNLSLSREDFLAFPVPAMTDDRLALIKLLDTLDDKIAVNERIAATARQLGLALFTQASLAGDLVQADVESVSNMLTRGIAPKYSESSEDLVVLNQKCIRDGRVSLTPARRTVTEKVKDSKLLRRNDVLVNSTGVGTLGRVARWTSDDAATVDSHITIVRFDEARVDPVCAGFALLRSQPEIEAMGEGSTGQTELRRAQLGGLEISLPSRTRQQQLRPKLDALEEQANQALSESLTLAALRDTLLPQLVSGRLRVKDAEKIVEDAT